MILDRDQALMMKCVHFPQTPDLTVSVKPEKSINAERVSEGRN